MKLAPALVLVAALVLLAIPPAAARIDAGDVGYCIGYADCDKKANDGFAFFCLKTGNRWYCMQCESCGNEPPIRAGLMA